MAQFSLFKAFSSFAYFQFLHEMNAYYPDRIMFFPDLPGHGKTEGDFYLEFIFWEYSIRDSGKNSAKLDTVSVKYEDHSPFGSFS